MSINKYIFKPLLIESKFSLAVIPDSNNLRAEAIISTNQFTFQHRWSENPIRGAPGSGGGLPAGLRTKRNPRTSRREKTRSS